MLMFIVNCVIVESLNRVPDNNRDDESITNRDDRLLFTWYFQPTKCSYFRLARKASRLVEHSETL